MDEVNLKKEDAESGEIVFNTEGDWLINISEDGIKFNREKYPDATPDDFAEAFMTILEQKFDVKFTKKLEDKKLTDFEI